ncbi:MAG: hypothetical protein ACLQU2_08785 [Candidatus Binataceae bacterium]
MRLAQAPHLTGLSHISEPELDMCRYERVESGVLARIYDKLRKLIVERRGIVSPMRSIGRELEESWPTGER